ncbi:MAG: ATP-binding protein [Candidatus Omnitrophota bacterium]
MDKARDNDLWVGDVSYDKDLNVYSTDISIKIKDEEGEFLGVMHVIWDIAEVIKTVESLKESLTSGLSIEKNKKAYAPKYSLLTADSKTIYSSEKQITLKNETDKKLSDMVSEKSGYHIMKSDVPGEEVLFAYARSKNFGNHKGLDWIILVEHKTSNIFKMITRIKRTIMFISVLGLCLALIIGFFIASSIFNPIKKLQDAVALIGKGNMDVNIDIDSRKGEVGALAASFKKMIVDLKRTTTSVNRLNEEIVERKRMENTLRESEERFKDLFENARDLIMLVNLEGRITAVNKIVREYGFRKEDLINKNILVFISPKNQQQAIDDLEKIKAGIIAKGEMEMVTPKGGLSIEYCNNPILKANKIVGAQSIMRDISSRKEMENVQRLTQLGKFVAAMAHEVNNPLMIISGNAQIALMEPFENEEVKKNLEVVFKECQRAKDIINRLLKFSKPSKKTKADTDANVVIEETVKLLEHQFSLDGVTINRSYTPGLPLISFDSKQLQEVLMNLLTNARDAILPEKGKIEVITLTEGSRVKIKVKDSGKGMDEKVMANIFQPFFTTKEKGTGLGLAVCYSLVHDAGGELKFESKPREGTTALIIVPVLPNNA